MNTDYSSRLNPHAYRTIRQKETCRDRFIPYLGDEWDLDLAHYKLTEPIKEESYWTPYQRQLSEVCFNMEFEEFKKRRVLLFKAPKRLPHSLLADYQRQQERAREAVKTVTTLAPKIDTILDAQGIEDDYYLKLMDLSYQNFLAVALGFEIYYCNLSLKPISVSQLNRPEDNLQITSLQWCGNGRYLSVGLENGVVEFWDIEAGRCLRSIQVDTVRIGAMASLNEASSLIFTGSWQGNVSKLDMRQSDAVITRWHASHQSEICGLKCAPSERHIVSGSNDNVACVWEVNGGQNAEPAAVLRSHQAAVKALAWHPNSRYVFSGGGANDRSIKMWDILESRRRPQSLISETTDCQVTDLQWVNNRLFSAHGFPDNVLASWKVDMVKGKLFKEHFINRAHDGRILTSNVFKDGTKLVTLGADETIKIWDISESTPKEPLISNQGPARRSLLSQFTIR